MQKRSFLASCGLLLLILAGSALVVYCSIALFGAEPSYDQSIFIGPLIATFLTAIFMGFWPGAFVAIISYLAVDALLDKPGAFFEDSRVMAHYLLSTSGGIILAAFLAKLRVGYFRLDQAQRRAQAEIRARENVVNVVSHDLRNPLASIQLSAGVIKKNFLLANASNRQFDEATLEKALQTILSSTAQMNRIITDLLDATRIEAGTFSLQLETVELTQLVQDAAIPFQERCREKDLTLTVRPPLSACQFRCDRTRIHQAVGNLLDNAIKFTSNPGTITLSADFSNRFVNLSVQDTGTGIPPKDLPHIFERYWQASKTAQLGTGLGLFITRGIVRSHQGEISIDSEPGCGTALTLHLPRDPLNLFSSNP